MQHPRELRPRPSEGRSLYRIVLADPPTLADFTSKAEAGVPLPRALGPEAIRLWDGISVFATESQARRAARRYPLLGSFITRLSVPTIPGVRYERTLGTPGHYTLWGDSALLLACVVGVTRV